MAKSKKVDYRKLFKGTTASSRNKLARTPQGQALLQALTPAELAELFPNYYRRSLPDMGRKPLAATTGGSGGGGTKGGGGRSNEEIDEQFLPTSQGQARRGTYSGSSNTPATTTQRRRPSGPAINPAPQLTAAEQQAFTRLKSGSIPISDPSLSFLNGLNDQQLKEIGIFKSKVDGEERYNYDKPKTKASEMSDEEIKKNSVLTRDANPRLAGTRSSYFKEMEESPAVKKLVTQAILAEGGRAGFQANLEQMMNYASARGMTRISQAVNSGFYGPVNRGEAQRRNISEAEQKIANEAFIKVRGGSNIIEYRTDQGMPGDPNYQKEQDPRYRPTRINGSFFADHPMFVDRKSGSWSAGQLKADEEWKRQYSGNMTPEQIKAIREKQHQEELAQIEQMRLNRAAQLRGTESRYGTATPTGTDINLPIGNGRLSDQNTRQQQGVGADGIIPNTINPNLGGGEVVHPGVEHSGNTRIRPISQVVTHTSGYSGETTWQDALENHQKGWFTTTAGAQAARRDGRDLGTSPLGYHSAIMSKYHNVDGTSVLDEKEYDKLSPDQQKAYTEKAQVHQLRDKDKTRPWQAKAIDNSSSYSIVNLGRLTQEKQRAYIEHMAQLQASGYLPPNVNYYGHGEKQSDGGRHTMDAGRPEGSGTAEFLRANAAAIRKRAEEIRRGGGAAQQRAAPTTPSRPPTYLEDVESGKVPGFLDQLDPKDRAAYEERLRQTRPTVTPTPTQSTPQNTPNTKPDLLPPDAGSLTQKNIEQEAKAKEEKAKEVEAAKATEKKDEKKEGTSGGGFGSGGTSSGGVSFTGKQLAQGGEIPFRDDERLKATPIDNTSVTSDKTGREYQINPNRETVKANLSKKVLEVQPDYKLSKNERADRGDKPQSADPARNAQPVSGNQGRMTQSGPHNGMPEGWNQAHINVDPSSVSSQRAFRQALHFTDGPHHNYGGPFNIVA